MIDDRRCAARAREQALARGETLQRHTGQDAGTRRDDIAASLRARERAIVADWRERRQP